MNVWKFRKRIYRLLTWITVALIIGFVLLDREYDNRLKWIRINTAPNNSSCILTLWYSTYMGLGNAMFVYASLYGVSRTFNYTAVIASKDPFLLHSLYGNQTLLPYMREFPLYSAFSGFLIDPDERCCVYSESNLRRLKNCDRPVRLNYYMQSWKYFHRYQEEVKRQFRCPKGNERLGGILNGDNLQQRMYDRTKYFLISVHIRRGDFMDKSLAALGYRHSSKAYVEKAMYTMKQTLQRLFPDSNKTTLFLMLGNDYKWNIKNFNASDNILVIQSSNSAFDDFCLLTQLEHTIITVGSFGWWVAYMTGGVVIYDKNYATTGSWLASRFEPEDYFLPEWIAVSDEEV